MNIQIYKTIGAAFLGVAAFIVSSRGQTIASEPAARTQPSAGLLGKRYESVDAYMERFRYAPLTPNTYGGIAAVNYPVFENFDAGLSYRYDAGNGNAMKIRDNVLEATWTGYYRLTGFDRSGGSSWLNGITPFATAGVGYSWNKITTAGIDHKNDHAYYRGVAGVEVPVYGTLSVRASAGYSDYFETFDGFHTPALRGWSYDLSANYWLTSKVGVSAGAAYDVGRSSTADSIVYRAGVRISF